MKRDSVLILSWGRSLSYRNQSINLQSKLMDWFLYDRDFRHERATAVLEFIFWIVGSFPYKDNTQDVRSTTVVKYSPEENNMSMEVLLMSFQGGIYLFKVNNGNTRTLCEICSKLTVKTRDWCQWRRSDVFINNFEHISHIFWCFHFLL